MAKGLGIGVVNFQMMMIKEKRWWLAGPPLQ